MLETRVWVEEGGYCDGCWTTNAGREVPLVVFQPSCKAPDEETPEVLLCADCLREMLRILEESKG